MMTTPERRSRMPGATSRVRRRDGHKVQSMASFQSESGAIRLSALPPPTLLTRMSTGPKACCAFSTSKAQPASVRTSPSTGSTTPPACRSSAVVSSSELSVRPLSTTCAPSAASAAAVALPSPRLEPVTIATRLRKPRSIATRLRAGRRTEHDLILDRRFRCKRAGNGFGAIAVLLGQGFALEHQRARIEARAQLVDAERFVAEQRLLDATGDLHALQVLVLRVIAHQAFGVASQHIERRLAVRTPGINHQIPLMRIEPVDADQIPHVLLRLAVLLLDQSPRQGGILNAFSHQAGNAILQRRDDEHPHHSAHVAEELAGRVTDDHYVVRHGQVRNHGFERRFVGLAVAAKLLADLLPQRERPTLA